MKKFEPHQKDAVLAKMDDPDCTVFESLDGKTWKARTDDAPFVLNPDVLYVAASDRHKKAAEACLIDGKAVEAKGFVFGVDIIITKSNVLADRDHWFSFCLGHVEITIKEDPIIMWVAATISTCTSPHNSAHELAKKLSLSHYGEIKDGQKIDEFTFNMIKIEIYP